MSQSKGLTFSDLKIQEEAPLRHWCGNNYLCGTWFITQKATAEGKVENKKVVFDVSEEKDIVCIEKIREIKKKFTPPE